MKKYMLAALVAVPLLLYGSTVYRDLLVVSSAIQTSTVDSTVIGGTTPAAAHFSWDHIVSNNAASVVSSGAWSMWGIGGSGLASETDFINQKGSGNGGFLWYNTNTGSLGSPLLSLDANGTLSTAGNFNTIAAKMSIAQINSTGTSATQGMYLMWNLGSSNEGDFFNVRTSGNGGFNWYNGTANSPGAAIMLLSNTGVLTVNSLAATSVVAAAMTGSLNGNAATATRLAATPSQCSGTLSTGVQSNGNANCIPIPNTFQWVLAAQGPTVGAASTQGAYIGWSMGGIGETDFVNSKGSGGGGWNWIDATSNTVVAFMDSIGVLNLSRVVATTGITTPHIFANNIQSATVGGCVTGSGAYSTCSATVNWPVGFSSSYASTCSFLNSAGFPNIINLVQSGDGHSITVTVANGTGAGAVNSGGGLMCIAHQN